MESFLDSTLGQAKTVQRSKQLVILGLSMSPLFDIASPSDMVRAANKLLDEWEVWSEGGGAKGMVSSVHCSFCSTQQQLMTYHMIEKSVSEPTTIQTSSIFLTSLSSPFQHDSYGRDNVFNFVQPSIFGGLQPPLKHCPPSTPFDRSNRGVLPRLSQPPLYSRLLYHGRLIL